MTHKPHPVQLLKRAIELLQADKAPAEALALLSQVERNDATHAPAQHLRAIAQFRSGNPAEAVTLLLDAIQCGERTPSSLLNLALATAATGISAAAITALKESLQGGIADKDLDECTAKIAKALGFSATGNREVNARLFEELFLPVMAWALQTKRMDYAFLLENLVYAEFVKATETESHYRYSMGRIASLMSESGEYWRKHLPVLPQPRCGPGESYKVGFFIHSASMLAHVEVLLSTLKGYQALEHRHLVPTVYCFSGKSEKMEAALKELGVRLVMLNEQYVGKTYSMWASFLQFRQLLADEGIHGIVWVSLATMMPLAFAMRFSPVQIWWAMKYHSLELKEIDGYLTGGSITRFRMIDGRMWRNGRLGADDWYDPALAEKALKIRNHHEGKLILASIGRTEKLADPEFLTTVVRILNANPDSIFLWPGRQLDQNIQSFFERGGVSDRTHFIGWVNTRLYAQVVDIFLDSFPFPSGFTLFQAMAAGKPVVIYESTESLDTGLYAFVGPVLAGVEGSPEEQQAVRELVYDGGERACISIARSPDEYAQQVQALIDDPEWRERCGRVSRALISTYLSDPKTMGATNFQHILEIMAERYPDLATLEFKA